MAITAGAAVITVGNYIIFVYIGFWNYVGLSILSGLVWGWKVHRDLKIHDADMQHMANTFINSYIKK